MNISNSPAHDSVVLKSLEEAKLVDTEDVVINEMRCITLQAFGKPFKTVKVACPIPVDGEVLVRVRAWYVKK
jgi:hypothetical protein